MIAAFVIVLKLYEIIDWPWTVVLFPLFYSVSVGAIKACAAWIAIPKGYCYTKGKILE